MIALLLGFLAAVLLGLVVVVIYLNARVNELETKTADAARMAASGDPNQFLRGLSGKKLWDTMTGKAPAALADQMEMLKSHYELVLSKHVEGLFQDGLSEGRKGQNLQPKSAREVVTTRGTVESWIPLNYANAIHRAGIDAAKGDLFDTERARMALDENAESLYEQAGLSISQPFSDMMLPKSDTSPGMEGAEGFDADRGGEPAVLQAPASPMVPASNATAAAAPAAAAPAPRSS